MCGQVTTSPAPVLTPLGGQPMDWRFMDTTA